MAVQPILDKLSTPARIQRLGVWGLAVILVLIIFEKFAAPETHLPSLGKRVRNALESYSTQLTCGRVLLPSLTATNGVMSSPYNYQASSTQVCPGRGHAIQSLTMGPSASTRACT
jgi:hypothetical protein